MFVTATERLTTLGSMAASAKPTGYGVDEMLGIKIPNPKMIPGVLNAIVAHGWKFEIYTQREESGVVFMGTPYGKCGFFKQLPPYEDEKILSMSRNLTGIDALRVGAHETAHAITVDINEMRGLVFDMNTMRQRISPAKFQKSEFYHRNEVIADSASAVVCCTLVPELAEKLMPLHAGYLALWNDVNRHLGEQKEVILKAVQEMLDSVTAKVTGVRYEVR